MERLVKKPQLVFTEAIKTSLGRLTDFNGRSRRSEFWWTAFAFYIATGILSMFTAFILPAIANSVLSVALLFFIFGVTVRRLHDTGRSGWWVVVSWAASAVAQIYMAVLESNGTLDASSVEDLMEVFGDPVYAVSGVVDVVTSIAVFIFCLLDGKPESNKYGASPKYVTEEEAFGEKAQE